MTWLGALGVIIGIGLVQYGEYKRKKIRVQQEFAKKVEPIASKLT